MPEFWCEKCRAFAGDDEVAGKSKLQPAPCSGALHRRDRNAPVCRHAAKELNRVCFGVAALHPTGPEIVDVRSGTEMRPVGSEDNRSRAISNRAVKRTIEFRNHCPRQGIVTGNVVKYQQRNAVFQPVRCRHDCLVPIF